MNTNKEEQNPTREKYTIIKLLGEGAYGKAYLVENSTSKEYYVIKTISLVNMTEDEIKSSKKEVEVLQKLDHPNIIAFKDAFTSNKNGLQLNIVTEFADDGDLCKKIVAQKESKNGFTENQILDLFTQICLAIKHIHSKHIIHRDLKSQNIFLSKGGLVKIGDFGIAKCLQNTWQNANTFIGTPFYMSPEIVKGCPYSYKSDIWSLGVLLYEMTMLRCPFEANSLPVLSLKIIKGVYSPISNCYSIDLRALVDRMLNLDPEKRPDVKEILNMPLIKNRIKSFLSEVEYDKEFSTTLVKKYKDEKKKIKIVCHTPNSRDKDQRLNFNMIYSNKPRSNNQIKIPNIVIKNKNENQKESSQKYKIINDPNDQSSNNDNNLINEAKHPEMNRKAICDFLSDDKPKDDKEQNKNKNERLPTKKHTQITKKDPAQGLLDLLNNNKKEKNRKLIIKPTIDFKIYWLNSHKKIEENTIKIKNHYFPNIVLVDKKVKDLEYNQNRLLNNLNNIFNGIEEEESEADENSGKNSLKNLDEQEFLVNNEGKDNLLEKNNDICVNKSDIEKEYKEIENIKEELKKNLGFEMYDLIYKCVDINTDSKLMKFDYNKIKNELERELKEKKYNNENITIAIDKIGEIFSIIVKEKTKNL